MLAAILGGRKVSLTGFVAGGFSDHRRRLVHLMRFIPLVRKRAAQHGNRRKGLHRQGQHHHNQQESF